AGSQGEGLACEGDGDRHHGIVRGADMPCEPKDAVFERRPTEVDPVLDPATHGPWQRVPSEPLPGGCGDLGAEDHRTDTREEGEDCKHTGSEATSPAVWPAVHTPSPQASISSPQV